MQRSESVFLLRYAHIACLLCFYISLAETKKSRQYMFKVSQDSS